MNQPKTWQEAWKMIQAVAEGMEGVEVFQDCVNVTGKNAQEARRLANAVNRKLKAEGIDYLSLSAPEEKWHYISYADDVESSFRHRNAGGSEKS